MGSLFDFDFSNEVRSSRRYLVDEVPLCLILSHRLPDPEATFVVRVGRVELVSLHTVYSRE